MTAEFILRGHASSIRYVWILLRGYGCFHFRRNDLQFAHAANKLLRIRLLRLQYGYQIIDRRLRIDSFAAGVAVQCSKTFLRIRMDGEMAFRQKHENSCALRFKLFCLYGEDGRAAYLSCFNHIRLQPFRIVQLLKICTPSVHRNMSSES